MTVNAFPKCLTCLVVLFLLKMVFEKEASRRTQQFGGGVAQNNLFQAESTGFPRGGSLGPWRVWPPSASLPCPALPCPFPAPANEDGSPLPPRCCPRTPCSPTAAVGETEPPPQSRHQALSPIHSQQAAESEPWTHRRPAQMPLCVSPPRPPPHVPA